MPIFTAAVISDIHIGGWGSTDSVSDRLLSARRQINDLCDFTVINGDLTQWYGAYSEQAFMNYHDSSYNSNSETSADDSLLHAGTSQWELLTEYLKGFEKPVYAVQGNHDIADSGKWNPVCCNSANWNKFLKSWIDYSNTAANTQKYENAVTKDDGVSYYDTVINGYEFIFLEIPRGEAPYYSFGDAQLEWLDKNSAKTTHRVSPCLYSVMCRPKQSLAAATGTLSLKAAVPTQQSKPYCKSTRRQYTPRVTLTFPSTRILPPY